MDALDAALLRGLIRGGVYDFPGVDPRRSVAELSKLVGVSRESVRLRLREWRTSGFHSATAVFVNPDILQGRFVGQYLAVPDPAQFANVEHELRQASDLFLIYEFESFVGRELMLATLRMRRDGQGERIPGPAPGAIAGLVPVSPEFEIDFPPSSVQLGPLDWGFIREIRADPELSLPDLAARCKISAKRARRRLNTLIDGNVIFYLPTLDLTRSRGTVLNITFFFPAGADAAALLERIRKKYPDLVPLTRRVHAELLLPPQPDRPAMTYGGFMLPVRTGQEAAEVIVALHNMEDIHEAAASYALRNLENRACYDALLRDQATRP